MYLCGQWCVFLGFVCFVRVFFGVAIVCMCLCVLLRVMCVVVFFVWLVCVCVFVCFLCVCVCVFFLGGERGSCCFWLRVVVMFACLFARVSCVL